MGRTKNMDLYRDIIHRLRHGQSIRSIHRDTKAHRTIVRQIRKLAKENGWLEKAGPMPSSGYIQSFFLSTSETITPKSNLRAFFEQIKEWHRTGCSPTVIYQLLVSKCTCSRRSVQRFIQKNFPKYVEPVMNREAVPGEVAEVDFGYFGIVYDFETQKNRKAWVFSMRLRYSRRAYRQFCFDQSVKTFFLCHIYGFEFFGGIPKKVVLDNLKAGVICACRTDPLINKVYIALAEHYGFLISPCAPRTPEHKGGVESEIKYIKKNFWPHFCAQQKEKGHEIPWAPDLPISLSTWGEEIADQRKVGGLLNTPKILFEHERICLKELPLNRCDLIEWKNAVVPHDWRIRFDNSYYSVPARLIGQKVMICAGTLTLKIFQNNDEVAVHPRSYVRGSFQRKTDHAPEHLESVLKASRESLSICAEKMGGAIQEVVEGHFANQIHDRLNAVRCILALENKVGRKRLEAACRRALLYGETGFKNIKKILERGLEEADHVIEPSGEYCAYEFTRTKEHYRV